MRQRRSAESFPSNLKYNVRPTASLTMLHLRKRVAPYSTVYRTSRVDSTHGLIGALVAPHFVTDMRSLLSLPAEILSQIIDCTLPEGIEAFALSCKAIYHSAGRQIRRHNALKKAWRSQSSEAVHLLLRLIGDGELDPLAARYIEDLDLWNFDGPPVPRHERILVIDVDEVDNADEARLAPDAVDRVKKAITESRFLKDANVNPDQWCEAMEKDNLVEGEEDYVEFFSLILLLDLVPNLKVLTLPYWLEYAEYEDPKMPIPVLDAMVDRSNSADGPLAKLTTIMPFQFVGYDSRASLQTVEPFLRLNGLRELYLVSALAVSDGYCGMPFKWRFPKLNSSLRRIELAYCCMSAEGISELLQHTPELEVFKYSHQVKWHGCLIDWNAREFVEAVGQHVGPTITQLAITTDGNYCGAKMGVTSFHAFSKLTDLEVDLYIFCGQLVQGAWGTRYLQQATRETKVREVEDLPSLASMLSGSIVKLQVNADFAREMRNSMDLEQTTLRVLLTQLGEIRSAKLKALDSVIIRAYNTEAARSVVDAVGAEVNIYCPERMPQSNRGEHRNPFLPLPAWKREFDQRVGGILRE